MIFLLIPIAWLALVTPLLAACVMASRADAPCTPAPEEPASWVGEGLTVWDPAAAAALAAGSAARISRRPGPRHGRRRRPLRSAR